MGWANDPYTRTGSGPDSPPPQWAEPTVVDYPLYPDPAYAGEQPPYTAGYTAPGVPAPPPAPTGYWQPPPGEPPASRPPPPPEPPRTPRWLAAHRGHGPAGGGPGRGVGDHRHLRLRPHRGAPVDPDAHAVLTGADRPAAPPGPPTADPDLPGSHTAVADQPGATDVHAPAGSHPGGELPGQRQR